MILKEVYAKDQQLLNDIRQQLKKYCPDLDTTNFFENVVPLKKNTQPLFIMGVKQNGSIGVLFSYISEIRFYLCFGQTIYLLNIFVAPGVTSDELNQFSIDVRLKYSVNKTINFNLDQSLFKPEKTEQYWVHQNAYYLYQDFKNHKHNPNLFKELEEKYPQYQFRYLELDDYDRGLFNIKDDMFISKMPTKQGLLNQLKKSRQSNSDINHIVIVKKQTNKLVGFVSILVYDTLRGKQGIPANLMLHLGIRSKGFINVILRMSYNHCAKYNQNFRIRLWNEYPQMWIKKNYIVQRRFNVFYKPEAMSPNVNPNAKL